MFLFHNSRLSFCTFDVFPVESLNAGCIVTFRSTLSLNKNPFVFDEYAGHTAQLSIGLKSGQKSNR